MKGSRMREALAWFVALGSALTACVPPPSTSIKEPLTARPAPLAFGAE